MIDLTKAPEGATHHIDDKYYRIQNGEWEAYSDKGRWLYSIFNHPTSRCIQQPIEIWSIYNNTLPLSELSDEQRGLLFNHWLADRLSIECSDCGVRWFSPRVIMWLDKCIYRAKQKTERELFIDEWSSKITTNEYNGGNVRSLVGQMFDDVNGK